MLCIVDPVIIVEVTAVSTPMIDQPLILQCSATIVRYITGTIDIVWTTRDTQIRRVNNVTTSSNFNSTSLYSDSFIIPSLDISDIGSVYQCEVLINSIIPASAETDFSIPFSGMYACAYIHKYAP